MRHTIFYISGLGDGYDSFRRRALKLWVIFGVRAKLIPMQWDNKESYEAKLQRVTNAIEKASARKDRITLIGESAGASMAINVFSACPAVENLITIAGVDTSSTPVAARRLRRSPAFAESRRRVDESLRRISAGRMAAVHTVRAISDNVVQAQHSQIKGATNHRIWTVGHFSTISLCLTLLSGYIIHLAKR